MANGSHRTLLPVDQPRCAQNATGNPTQRDKIVLPSPVATAFFRPPKSPGEWGQPKKPVGRTDAMAQRWPLRYLPRRGSGFHPEIGSWTPVKINFCTTA
jgi:hypothetical protein